MKLAHALAQKLFLVHQSLNYRYKTKEWHPQSSMP